MIKYSKTQSQRPGVSGNHDPQVINCAETALKYLNKGYSIIPIGKEKKPLIYWQEFQKRLPTSNEVVGWFKKWPEAGIAIVTGKISDIVVIDVDPRNGGSSKNFANYNTVESITGGGGNHFIFKYPDFDVPTIPNLLKGIDLKSDGGYAIVPPSTHPNGNKYIWKKDILKNALLALPNEISNLIKKHYIEKPKFDSALLSGVSEGSRNHSAASVVGKWLKRYPEKEWESEVWPMVLFWNRECTPPLPKRELRSVFLSIASREKESVKNTNDTYLNTGNSMETPIRDTTFFSFDPRLIGDLSAEKSRVEWIWDGYLAKGHVTLFSALWKAGKSTLLSQLLKSMQLKQSLAGQDTRLNKVMVLSEESEGIWVKRRDELGLDMACWLVCRPIKQKLNYKQWLSLLNESSRYCIEKGIDLLVVDTLAGFWSVIDENNASQVNASLIPLNNLLNKNISVLLIHHFRKSGGSEGTAARGSGALGSFADIMIDFTRLDGENIKDTKRMLRSYSRFEETPPEVVIELINGKYVVLGTRSEVSKNERIKNVVAILKGSEESLSVQEIHQSWDSEELGRKPSNRTVANYVEALLEDNKIVKTGEKLVGKTKASVYHLSNNERKASDTSYKNSIDMLEVKKIFEI